MLKKLIIHPLFFILYSVISLFSANIDRVSINETYRVTLTVLTLSTLLFIALRILTGSWGRAGLICSLVILLFSTYGHMYRLLTGVQIIGIPIGQANYIAAAWASLLIIITWMIIRILKDTKRLNEILNIISIAYLIFPLANIGLKTANDQLTINKMQLPVEYVSDGRATGEFPDIYYIILDEYGRADVLNEIMAYDNTAFIDELKQRGFYIADQSRTNYIITLMSIASSLNSQYLDNVVPSESTDASRIIELINNNKTMAFLKEKGYLTITFATGYHFSEIKKSDYRFSPDGYINDFELAYLENSILSIGINSIYGPRYRSLFLHNFERLEEIPEVEPGKPKFTFAHILAAHAPFVFGPHGETISPWNFNQVIDTSGVERRSYTEVYTDQLSYANQKILTAVDNILAQYEDNKPIIILQSDHGPESMLDWYSIENSCLKERASIFNAYYFPDKNYGTLYPNITPVNTFRIIFNEFFGTNLNSLEDRSYFSIWNKPYDFIDITNQITNCDENYGVKGKK